MHRWPTCMHRWPTCCTGARGATRLGACACASHREQVRVWRLEEGVFPCQEHARCDRGMSHGPCMLSTATDRCPLLRGSTGWGIRLWYTRRALEVKRRPRPWLGVGWVPVRLGGYRCVGWVPVRLGGYQRGSSLTRPGMRTCRRVCSALVGLGSQERSLSPPAAKSFWKSWQTLWMMLTSPLCSSSCSAGSDTPW